MSPVIMLLAIVAGSAIVGLSAAYFFRARAEETVEATKPPANVASAAAPVPIADEVRAIGEKIEQAMADQRTQGETQRQLLSQKLDSVRKTVENQRNHVEGLRSELRHEVRRRDAEMDEIRTQIGTIQRSVQLPPAEQAALPPPAAPAEGLEAPAAVPPAPEPARPEPVAEPEPAFEEATFAEETFAAPAPGVEPVAPPHETAEESAFEEVAFEEVAFEEVAFEEASSVATTPEEPAFEAPDAEPEDPFATAPLYDAPPGDSVPSDDVFEAWTPGPPAPPVVAPPTEEAPEPEAPEPEAPELEASEPSVFEPVSFDPVAFDVPPAEPEPASPFEDVAFEAPEGLEAAPAAATDAPPEPPATPEPTAETAWVARPTPQAHGLVDLDGDETPEAAGQDLEAAPPATDEPEPAIEAPEGAEDLTVISSIDAHTQRLLYQNGVVTLDEIAQWGRGDARRIASRVEVSEETIMNQWVFEAQAALFNRFSQQAGV